MKKLSPQRHRGTEKTMPKSYRQKDGAENFMFLNFSVSLYPQGVGRGCKGLKPQQRTLCLCGEWFRAKDFQEVFHG